MSRFHAGIVTVGKILAYFKEIAFGIRTKQATTFARAIHSEPPIATIRVADTRLTNRRSIAIFVLSGVRFRFGSDILI